MSTLQMMAINKFGLALAGIFIFSFSLRFWNLGQFNALVFDEVYYAVYANNYLVGQQFFQSHPPLSQYLIAFSIWIGSHFPASPDTINTLTGTARSTFSYRWLNAFAGSFIPLAIGAIAYQLTARKSTCIFASLLAALDGLFLVESRYALNNIYLVLFGLLGNLFFLVASRKSRRFNWLLLSGSCLGLSFSIKWNGAGFLLGVLSSIAISPWVRVSGRRVADIGIAKLLVALILLPLAVYVLLWLPHLKLNPNYNFLQVHQAILSFHQRIGPDAHPYCSPWYSWPFLWRPVAYYYKRDGGIVHDVHAMGNPVLWLVSTGAIAFLLSRSLSGGFWRGPDRVNRWITVYILGNYIANLLPWVGVRRCTFLYHYMASYTFAWIALAWVLSESWESSRAFARATARVTLVLIVLAFFYWLPVYLGLPLSVGDHYRRMFLPNWI